MNTTRDVPRWGTGHPCSTRHPRINRRYIDCYGRKLRVVGVSPEGATVIVEFENRHCQDVDEALWRELGPIDVERIAASRPHRRPADRVT